MSRLEQITLSMVRKGVINSGRIWQYNSSAQSILEVEHAIGRLIRSGHLHTDPTGRLRATSPHLLWPNTPVVTR